MRDTCERLPRVLACAVWALLALGSLASSATALGRDVTDLAPLDDASFWTFEKNQGDGEFARETTPDGAAIVLQGNGGRGMAATVRSPGLAVKPNREYLVEMQIRTEALEPVTAGLVGATYFQFNDRLNWPAGLYPTNPILGAPVIIAPRDTDWTTVRQTIKTPSTAGSAVVHLAYAGFGTWAGGHPRVSGLAKGKLWIRGVTIREGDAIEVPRASVRVPDETVQQAADLAAATLHNTSLGGHFVVSDGYTISGNIVPDIAFGLFGVRRLAEPRYIEMMRDHWRRLAATMNDEGRITSQRVMAQVLWPLGVDEIYGFTGDDTFLKESLPLADRAIECVIRRGDEDGLSRLVEYGKWRIGEGADWVDWYPARMEGKTVMFHIWYVRALRRMAALHEESHAKGIGSVEKAKQYRQLADRVVAAIRAKYWRDDHFMTNIDFGGKVVDERWMDDQVWAIRTGVATPEQTKQIWEWVDRDAAGLEGVPTRWASFPGPDHGPSSWFGRTGGGDILARYATGRADRGISLIRRISEIFARDGNIYEAYNMQGKVVSGTGGWGNYTEHAGGFVWAVTAGPLGIDLDSDGEAVASLAPQLPPDWNKASATIHLRGEPITIDYDRQSDRSLVVRLRGGTQPRPVRVGGRIVVVDGNEQRIVLPTE